jgi:hypothetical protein
MPLRNIASGLVFQTYRQTFRLNDYRNELLLEHYPVVEVLEVLENDTTLATGTAGADTEVNRDTGSLLRLRNGSQAWWPRGTIQVTYGAGYGDDTGLPILPPSVQRAAILLSCNFSRAKRDPSIRSIAHGDRTVTYGLDAFATGDGLPAEIVALLKPYRDYRV